MTKIYRTFEDWWSSRSYIATLTMDKNQLKLSWNARQPEIDALHERVAELQAKQEFRTYD